MKKIFECLLTVFFISTNFNIWFYVVPRHYEEFVDLIE